MTGTSGRLMFTGVLGFALCGTAVLGQPPRPAPPTAPADFPRDPIDVAKARQRIADQRAQSTVLAAIREAERLARSNPARASQVLRAAQTDIDLAVGISADTRTTLTGLLQARLNGVMGRENPVTPGVRPDPRAAMPRLDRQAAFDRYSAEVKAVRDGVDQVSKYQAAGRAAEADRVIRDLARQYPNNPSVISLTQKDNFKQRVEDARLFALNQGDRMTAALRAVDRSAIPAGRDVEFPPDWKEKTERRKNTVRLTAKEKAIIESLGKPLTVNYNGQSLQEALQDLSTQMDQPLSVDTKSLADLGIDLTKGVNLQGKNVTARTVLRQVLGSAGLTFVIKDETIQVVTVEKAQTMLVARVYYLGDVVQGVGPFAGSLTWGPYIDFQQTMANVQLIIDSIQKSVDPLSWKVNGGPATITFHYPSMSIIVRASTEVHSALGSKIGGGR